MGQRTPEPQDDPGRSGRCHRALGLLLPGSPETQGARKLPERVSPLMGDGGEQMPSTGSGDRGTLAEAGLQASPWAVPSRVRQTPSRAQQWDTGAWATRVSTWRGSSSTTTVAPDPLDGGMVPSR